MFLVQITHAKLFEQRKNTIFSLVSDFVWRVGKRRGVGNKENGETSTSTHLFS